MPVLEDRLISLRLSRQPEFHARLAEFIHSYRIADTAALVVQARPSLGTTHRINVDDANVRNRFREGVGNHAWWDGFASVVAPQRTFHGIGSLPARESPTWASEAHRDGHFIAGIWRFPVLRANATDVPCVADFYAAMFSDFLSLVAVTLQAAGVEASCDYDVTWTLTNAPQLYYAGRSDFGQHGITAQPLQVLNLQYPIATATVGSADWARLGMEMGQTLTGAYGGNPTQ